MIIISIDIVKHTYAAASFPPPFFLFYNGKHPKTLDYISVNIGQASVIFFLFFMKMHQMSLTFAPCSDRAAFCFAKIHNIIVNCVYSNHVTIPCENSTHFLWPN